MTDVATGVSEDFDAHCEMISKSFAGFICAWLCRVVEVQSERANDDEERLTFDYF